MMSRFGAWCSDSRSGESPLAAVFRRPPPRQSSMRLCLGRAMTASREFVLEQLYAARREPARADRATRPAAAVSRLLRERTRDLRRNGESRRANYRGIALADGDDIVRTGRCGWFVSCRGRRAADRRAHDEDLRDERDRHALAGARAVSGSYKHALDRQDTVRLSVRWRTRRRDVVDYAVTLVAFESGVWETIRVYDGAHGINELHRYTQRGGKQGGAVFHAG